MIMYVCPIANSFIWKYNTWQLGDLYRQKDALPLFKEYHPSQRLLFYFFFFIKHISKCFRSKSICTDQDTWRKIGETKSSPHRKFHRCQSLFHPRLTSHLQYCNNDVGIPLPVKILEQLKVDHFNYIEIICC